MEPTIGRRKDQLDLFAEMLLYLSQLSRAFFASASEECDRTVYRNAFKALIDVLRYGESGGFAGSAPQTRHDMTQAICRNRSSPFHPIVLRFLAWQAQRFSPSADARSLIGEALYTAFVTLRDRARDLEATLAGSEKGPTRYEVLALGNEYQRDTLSPGGVGRAWQEAAERILAACADSVRAVWPSYYHLYVVMGDETGEAGLAN